ncbi:hypothetical protein JD969_03745 [Planctomycetota bacterium]|nr:hypothetical protein JD969_03745 [Planctomycetota bacterium]
MQKVLGNVHNKYLIIIVAICLLILVKCVNSVFAFSDEYDKGHQSQDKIQLMDTIASISNAIDLGAPIDFLETGVIKANAYDDHVQVEQAWLIASGILDLYANNITDTPAPFLSYVTFNDDKTIAVLKCYWISNPNDNTMPDLYLLSNDGEILRSFSNLNEDDISLHLGYIKSVEIEIRTQLESNQDEANVVDFSQLNGLYCLFNKSFTFIRIQYI